MKPMNSILVAGLIAAGLAAPALAYDAPSKHVVIKRIGPDGKPITLEGADAAQLLSDCRNQNRDGSNVTTGEGKDKRRVSVVICSKDGTANTPETRRKLADALERVRVELGSHEDMTPGSRAEAAAALDREIARLRGQARD